MFIDGIRPGRVVEKVGFWSAGNITIKVELVSSVRLDLPPLSSGKTLTFDEFISNFSRGLTN